MQIAKERLYLNAKKTKLVPADNKDAATLYCTPGDNIPDSAVEKFGLVDGKLNSQKGKGANKETKPGDNKDGKDGSAKGKDGGGGSNNPPELTDVDGIGPATATRLAAADIGDVAKLSAVNLENPPTIEGLPPAFDWAKVTTAAKALTVPAE